VKGEEGRLLRCPIGRIPPPGHGALLANLAQALYFPAAHVQIVGSVEPSLAALVDRGQVRRIVASMGLNLRDPKVKVKLLHLSRESAEDNFVVT
jgi:hypothetical protein